MRAYTLMQPAFKETLVDLKSILPFLLSGNKQGNSAPNPSTDALLNSLLLRNGASIPPEILSSAINGNENRPTLSGISPIIEVVPDELLGKIVKYLNKVK